MDKYKICVYSIFTCSYIKHVPLFLYSGLYYYPNIYFKIFVDSKKNLGKTEEILNDNGYKNRYKIEILPEFNNWEWYVTIHRGLIDYNSFKEFDYCICFEGDIIFTNQTITENMILSSINTMKLFNIPFLVNIRYANDHFRTFEKYNEENFINYFVGRPSSVIKWRETTGNRAIFTGFMFDVNYYYKEYNEYINEYSYLKKKELVDTCPRYKIKNDECWFFYFLMLNKNIKYKFHEILAYYHLKNNITLKNELKKYGIDYDSSKYEFINKNRKYLFKYLNLLHMVHLGEYRGKTKNLKIKRKIHKWDEKIKGYKKLNLQSFLEDELTSKLVKNTIKCIEYNIFTKEFYMS